MIVWGGEDTDHTNSGGIYDLGADTWTPTSTAGAPAARSGHTAVWTGSKMIIWGGADSYYGYMNTGGIYDPVTDAWTPTSTAGAPAARSGHTAVWTGSKMIIWGGQSFTPLGQVLLAIGIYDPVTDTWTPTSTAEEVPPTRATAVWTGSRMIVWGGNMVDTYTNTGRIYDPATDRWTPTGMMGAPAGRSDHTAVWTGSKMTVWGGFGGGGLHNTGGIYDPVTDTWAPTSTTGAPTRRGWHTAVWTGVNMIVWGGGELGSTKLDTGGVYSNPALLPPSPPPGDFYTVTPCRLVDTRDAAGPSGGPALYAGATRAFPVTGGVCGIPSTATAVSVNVTAVRAATNGHLTLCRGDVTNPPPTSNINFVAGATRASNAIVLLATNFGTINVMNRSAGTVHFVLDVNGYFQ